jgi:transcriptional regulator with PAS, ATPase and Fis domain
MERAGYQIIGISPAMKTLSSLILMVAASDDTSVLITGESGTGKELVARGIHIAGNRHKHPFHAVNCSAIPESLFESEFFGYHKGAFTGAAEKSTGWFESSNHGTLFLDEITELPRPMQSKFLRVLDDKTISKIGSHQQIKLNLRIIAATNQDFGKLLSKNAFREDLFHRLNSFHIHVPPLRERKEDIPILLNHFVSEISKRLNKTKNEICPNAIEKMLNYPFPGNVRELKNMVERAVILAQNKKLKLHHFCIEPGGKTDPNIAPCSENSLMLNVVERNAIIDALDKTRNNKSRAAALLAISRQALDRKISKLKLFKVS